MTDNHNFMGPENDPNFIRPSLPDHFHIPEAKKKADPMSTERLAEIRARCEAATEGPWRVSPYKSGKYLSVEFLIDGKPFASVALYVHDETDADFIAAARQDVPYLLDEIEARDERLKFSLSVLNEHLDAHKEKDAEIARLTAVIQESIDDCGMCSGIGTEHYVNETLGEDFIRPCPDCKAERAALEETAI